MINIAHPVTAARRPGCQASELDCSDRSNRMRIGSDLPHALGSCARKRRTAETEKGVIREETHHVRCVSQHGLPSSGRRRIVKQQIDRLDHAGRVMSEIMAAPDKGIPEEVLEHAQCVAVVPHLLKGGFVFGAENGRGVATCRTANGWSAPAFFAITGGSWGLQIGVEGVDLVMIIQNERGMQQLISSGFQLGGDASAAAGPVGRHASANTNWKLETEILTYSRARGAFAGHHADRRFDSPRRRLDEGHLRTSRLHPLRA